jgi:hypothetical protein
MTQDTDQRLADSVLEDQHENQDVTEDQHEDLEDQEAAEDEIDGPEDIEAPLTPDELAVQNFLSEGPHGPQGRVEMAAAGIEVDDLFPADDADEHIGESDEDSVDGRPAMAFVEQGNRWEGDRPFTVGQTLTPDPSHPGTIAMVVHADPAATAVSAAAARLPVVTDALLTVEAEQGFLDRWNAIQIGFVVDPAQSVDSADALIVDIASAYTDAFVERRESLAATRPMGDPGTDDLRHTLLQYRSFIGVILPK